MSRQERVILDTNLWISYLISDRFISIDLLIMEGRIRLLFSEELLTEFLAVVSRPKLRKYFTETDVESLLQLFDVYGEVIKVESSVDICRDPKDNFLLALAKEGKADYLLTGDKDLLVLGTYVNTKIITFREFLDTFGPSGT